MDERYDPLTVEAKWQRLWRERRTHSTDLANAQRPYYTLMMFLAAAADSAMVFAVSEAGDRPVQNTPASQPPMPSRGGQLESSFALQLAPGTYRVFAVRNAEEFEYGDPDLLRKYADNGQQVTIARISRLELSWTW